MQRGEYFQSEHFKSVTNSRIINYWQFYDDNPRFLVLLDMCTKAFHNKLASSDVLTTTYLFELDDSSRRGHNQQLLRERFRLDVKKFAYRTRVVNIGNLYRHNV